MSGSEKEITLEGAAQEKVVKGNSGMGEREQWACWLQRRQIQSPIPEYPQKGAYGHNILRNILSLIKKWCSKVMAAGSAVNVVTERDSVKIVSSVEFHNISKKITHFYNERG